MAAPAPPLVPPTRAGGWAPLHQPGGRPARSRPTAAHLVSLLAVALLLLEAAWLLGGGLVPIPASLPDPGVLTRWGLPAARLLLDLCAVGTVGALLAGAVLAPRSGAGWAHPVAARSVRAARWWATGWAGTAAVAVVLTLSEVSGVPPGEVIAGDVVRYTWSLPHARALLVVLALAAVIAVLARGVQTTGGARLTLVLALLTLTPTLYTGHSAQTADHETATGSLVVHVVAATLWFGGLLGLTVHLRGDGLLLARAASRFSVLALGCFIVVAFSGLVAAYARLGATPSAWTSPYGAILSLKMAGLLALGAFGWHHRRRTLGPLAQGRPRAFMRLAGAELLVMAATVGLAAALSRTPAPLASGPAIGPDHEAGHPILGQEVVPVTLARLVTQWRPDPITITLVLIALAAYLYAVARVSARGVPWPWYRTAATVVAAAIALLALSGGVASYSTALLSVNIGQYLTLTLIVPALVTSGAPVTLARLLGHADQPAAPRAGAVTRAVLHPVHGCSALIVVTVLLYATPLLEASLGSTPARLTANAAAFATGVALWWSVLAVDAVPIRSPARDRTGVLIATLVFLTAFGTVLATRVSLFGSAWFGQLSLDWVDPAADQRRAGVVVWFFVLVLGALAVAVSRSGLYREATTSGTLSADIHSSRPSGRTATSEAGRV